MVAPPRLASFCGWLGSVVKAPEGCFHSVYNIAGRFYLSFREVYKILVEQPFPDGNVLYDGKGLSHFLHNFHTFICYSQVIDSILTFVEEIMKEKRNVSSDQTPAQSSVAMNTAGFLAIIILAFLVLQKSNLLNYLVPAKLGDSTMSLGMLFVLGLITSVHCVAMCGGINLSQSIKKNSTSMKSALLYNAGRVVSYTAIGFILGLAGFVIGGGKSAVGFPLVLQVLLKIIAGIFMLIAGINILGLFPLLSKIKLVVPEGLSSKIATFFKENRSAFIVGLLNGFMPCGPLQSMWIVALASASPLTGALSMFLFSLGTVPLMLGLGTAVSAFGKKFARQVTQVGAIIVAVMGLAMISQGKALAGSLQNRGNGKSSVTVISSSGQDGTEKNSSRSDSVPNGVTIKDGVQYVESTLRLGRYPAITVKKGMPVKWTINAPEGSLNGCNYRMIIRALDLGWEFDYGKNEIEFTADTAGTIPYTCWMGMIRGTITVVE